jgi:hypothetical protein
MQCAPTGPGAHRPTGGVRSAKVSKAEPRTAPCVMVRGHPAQEGAVMASKDKGGGKGSKTAASKSLKEKRAAKKAKGSSSSGSGDWNLNK